MITTEKSTLKSHHYEKEKKNPTIMMFILPVFFYYLHLILTFFVSFFYFLFYFIFLSFPSAFFLSLLCLSFFLSFSSAQGSPFNNTWSSTGSWLKHNLLPPHHVLKLVYNTKGCVCVWGGGGKVKNTPQFSSRLWALKTFFHIWTP